MEIITILSIDYIIISFLSSLLIIFESPLFCSSLIRELKNGLKSDETGVKIDKK